MLEVQHTHEHLPLLCLNRTLKVAKFQTIKNKALSKRFLVKCILKTLFIKKTEQQGYCKSIIKS